MSNKRSAEAQKRRAYKKECYVARREERNRILNEAFFDREYGRVKEIVSRNAYFWNNVDCGEVLVDGYGTGHFQRIY